MKRFFVRVILALVSVVLLVQLWIFASLVWWRTQPVNTSMFMRIASWSEPSKPLQHHWRDYDNISNNFKRAVVAAEDGKFLQHHGFDWDGIQYALEKMKNQVKWSMVDRLSRSSWPRIYFYSISVLFCARAKKRLRLG